MTGVTSKSPSENVGSIVISLCKIFTISTKSGKITYLTIRGKNECWVWNNFNRSDVLGLLLCSEHYFIQLISRI